MTDDLKHQIQSLFRDMDADTTPLGPPPTAHDAARIPAARHTWNDLPIIRFALAATVVLVATTVIAIRLNADDIPNDAPNDAPNDQATTPTVPLDPTLPSTTATTATPGTTVTAPTTTAAPITPITPTTVPTEDVDIDAQMAAIITQVNSALGQLTSFSATATIHTANTSSDSSSGQPTSGQPTNGQPTSGQPADTTTINQVTLFGNGLMWVEPAAGGWSSFDPLTGTSQLAYIDPATQTLKYQQINGWTENNVGLSILFGGDPVTNVAVLQAAATAGATITDVIFDGRDAWSIVRTTDAFAFPGQSKEATATSTIVIDKASGLTVRTNDAVLNDDGVTTSIDETSLTGLVANVDVPPAFPGAFPPGAEIDISGAALVRGSIEEIANRFGPGFVAPADLDPAALVGLVEIPASTGAYDSTQLTASIITFNGFLKTTIEMRKFVFISGTPDDGQIVVDGGLCNAAPDGISCASIEPTAGDTIISGALAGHFIQPGVAGAGFQLGSTIISINNPDPALLATIVNNLVESGGGT